MAILLQPGVVMIDLAVPLQVFGPWPSQLTCVDPEAINPYRLRFASSERDPLVGGALLPTETQPLDCLVEADTVVVPGLQDPLAPVPAEVSSALVRAAARGTRMVSICVGAFVLAAAGILDGRRVTTHWYWADELRHRYPRVDVQEHHLYVDDGQVLSSAGLLAGVDLCLHVLRRDLGQRTANTIARYLVSAPHRDGGQAQFIHRPVPDSGGSLAEVRHWLLENLAVNHTLSSIARRAHLGVRTLTRRFRAETGVSVMDWLTRQRVDRARELLEETDRPIALIADDVGFGSLETMRTHFVHFTGTSPQHYRRVFRTPGPPVVRGCEQVA